MLKSKTVAFFLRAFIYFSNSQIHIVVFNGVMDVHRGILLQKRNCTETKPKNVDFLNCVINCGLDIHCQICFETNYGSCAHCASDAVVFVEPKVGGFAIGMKVPLTRNITESCPAGKTIVEITTSGNLTKTLEL